MSHLAQIPFLVLFKLVNITIQYQRKKMPSYTTLSGLERRDAFKSWILKKLRKGRTPKKVPKARKPKDNKPKTKKPKTEKTENQKSQRPTDQIDVMYLRKINTKSQLLWIRFNGNANRQLQRP